MPPLGFEAAKAFVAAIVLLARLLARGAFRKRAPTFAPVSASAKLFPFAVSRLTIDETPTVEYTCATIVNRLPILGEAEPGYLTTDQQAMAEFRTYSLHVYLQR